MRYRIPDEPTTSGLSSMAVQPLWPLLAIMFGGAWLSWPWFAFNAFATGSPTRGRELALAIGGFVGTVAIALGLSGLIYGGVITKSTAPYAFVSVTVWKLVVSYVLYSLQSRSFHLYEHFGGSVRSGFPLAVVAGFMLRTAVLGAFASNLWKLVVS